MWFDETPLIMIETPDALDEAVERLSRAPVIALDTESDSSYAYQEKVCLIQLSDLRADFIVDPLAIGDISALAPLLADRSIVKVLHGADYDIVCLKRDFNFRIRGLFDTLIAAQLIGMERIGLADLILRHFGVEIDKQYQRHNWALRPLRPEHLEYARGDTHYLLALRELLLSGLRRVGRVRHFREECALLERREWQGRTFDPDGWLDIKRAGELDELGMRILRRLYLYRDSQARSMNRPAYKVIPDDVLVGISKVRPASRGRLRRPALLPIGPAPPPRPRPARADPQGPRRRAAPAHHLEAHPPPPPQDPPAHPACAAAPPSGSSPISSAGAAKSSSRTPT